MKELKVDGKGTVSGKCLGAKNDDAEKWSFSCGGNSIEALVKTDKCKVKKPPALVCGDDGAEVTTNEPEVTTEDPENADCKCGGEIEKFSKDRFNIKCLGVKEGKKKGKTEETWQFTCPKTGKSKSYTNPKCKKIAKKAKKFCA